MILGVIQLMLVFLGCSASALDQVLLVILYQEHRLAIIICFDVANFVGFCCAIFSIIQTLKLLYM